MWVLVLMVFAPVSGHLGIAVSPHTFQTEAQCKRFVAELRRQHEQPSIEASCIEQHRNLKDGE